MTRSPADATTRESFAGVVARLAAAQKSRAPGAPAYSIYVNRPFGRLLAAAAYLAGLTPNAVTAISAAFTFSAIVVIAVVPPTPWIGVVIGFLLIVGYALDSADGQVARLRGGGSPAGEWLDHVVDAAKTSSLHLAVLVSWQRFVDLPSELLLLVPIGFAIVAAVLFFATILNDFLRVRSDRRGKPAGGGIRSLLVLPTDYGVLCFAFLLFGVPTVFVPLYGILFVANVAFALVALPKWFREISRIPR
ncbi:CDP-alcohol phosphatidyltransferase family protein [Agromyces sp. SYSU K20354]|uniref:CDP-alcohol phosphatidyltransferase family protein n=1 Tax=Agromyces cavernae TaxID=2898659 RepID=UPI001E4ADD9F|nr:CDP-alcohol phosphatidyltransferase family protein [Agromyces cavernae]MCD2440989.1 CDP-alcohol phosphatidyltransferase family protein [Agromyces cavernae]